MISYQRQKKVRKTKTKINYFDPRGIKAKGHFNFLGDFEHLRKIVRDHRLTDGQTNRHPN